MAVKQAKILHMLDAVDSSKIVGLRWWKAAGGTHGVQPIFHGVAKVLRRVSHYILHHSAGELESWRVAILSKRCKLPFSRAVRRPEWRAVWVAGGLEVLPCGGLDGWLVD